MASASIKIKFNTIKKLAIQKKAKLLLGIDAIISQFRKGGLNINTILTDQEFNAL